jgi:hypothetical protein
LTRGCEVLDERRLSPPRVLGSVGLSGEQAERFEPSSTVHERLEEVLEREVLDRA